MMDQILNSMNGAPQVDLRDKPSAPSAAGNEREKAGFSDTLSSVKSNEAPREAQQHAKDDRAGHEDAFDADEGDAPDDKAKPAVTEAPVKAKPRSNALDAFKDKLPKVLAQAFGDEATATDSLKKLNADDADLTLVLGSKGVVDEDAATMQGAGIDVAALIAEGADTNVTAAQKAASLLISADLASAMSAADGVDAKDGAKDARLDTKNTGKSAERNTASALSALATQSTSEDGPEFVSESEATYRFNASRGDGVRSMDMAVRSKDGRVDFEIKENAGRITENVNVLDSRRFLGLATPTNASSIAGLIASDADWVSAMRAEASLANSAAQSSAGKVVHTLKLQLTPIDLGSVTMSLRMVGEELAVHMTVENMNAYRRLQEDNRQMMDALKAHGITVEQITISVSASERSDQSQGQANGQGQQNAQFAGEDARGNAAGNRNRADESAQGREHHGGIGEGEHDSREPGDTGVYL